MSLLLALPRELRDSIIEEVLIGYRTPPRYPVKTDRIDFDDIRYRAWRKGPKTYHEQPSTHSSTNCSALLLTNRQIHDETRSILSRKSFKTCYRLDVSILNEYDLFPTWTSVPCLTTRVRELNVDVRLFGSIIPRGNARRLIECGGRLGFHWSFYALLERFLCYGPVGGKKAKDHLELANDSNGISRLIDAKRRTNFEDRRITVDVLTLDVQSCETGLPFPSENIGYEQWLGQHTRGGFPDRKDTDLKMWPCRARPEWIAEYLSEVIEILLGIGDEAAHYGEILYARVGSIRIIHPGGTIEVDIANRLANLTCYWPSCGSERTSALNAWKKKMLTRRHELGFPVVWPKDLEETRAT